MVITCDGPKLSVELNGLVVSRMNLDEWTEPNRRPDGSSHKFDVAYKNHPRWGNRPPGSWLGLLVQEHQAQGIGSGLISFPGRKRGGNVNLSSVIRGERFSSEA